MLLYDTYREIVNDLDNGNRLPNKPVKGVDGNIIDPIIRRDPLCEFYDFEKLVAGSFILLGSSLDNVAVNVNRLREYVEEAKKIYESLEVDQLIEEAFNNRKIIRYALRDTIGKKWATKPYRVQAGNVVQGSDVRSGNAEGTE